MQESMESCTTSRRRSLRTILQSAMADGAHDDGVGRAKRGLRRGFIEEAPRGARQIEVRLTVGVCLKRFSVCPLSGR